MILYTNSIDTLPVFHSKINQAMNEHTGKKYTDIWKDAGGQVIENENLVVDLFETIREQHQELDSARDMIELQAESLKVKNEKLEKLEKENARLIMLLADCNSRK